MKNSLAVMAVVATLFAVLPSAPQAQTPPGPVLQQVQVPVARARVPDTGSGSVFVRYILIDPGNAEPVRDGFAPLERVAAVVDAANDFNALASGLRGHRLGTQHRADLQAVMNDLRVRYPGLPIWALGNSRGTISAAVMGIAVTPPADGLPADGLVLTSSLTGPDSISEDLNGVALESITAPALIVTHLDDACPITRPEDSDALRDRFSASSRVHVMHVSGGSTPVSNACDPLAPHGFFGIDQKVVDAITKWIKHSEH